MKMLDESENEAVVWATLEAQSVSSSKKMRDALRSLKKDEEGTHAKLASIALDAQFVELVVERYFEGLQVFGNLRAGAWYVKGAKKERRYCTFKSGDGHSGKVAFSSRRLNLNVLKMAAASDSRGCKGLVANNCVGGAVIVDSTRQGKRFPDSMTRTIPLWCMVLNFVKFGERKNLFPPWVSEHEARRILEELDVHAQNLPPEALQVVQSELHHPLRPIWICPSPPEELEIVDYAHWERVPEVTLSEDLKFEESSGDCKFVPIVLVSSSVIQTQEGDRTHRSWRYVQGAGDDEEFWSSGLTHELFWANEELFRNCRSNEETLDAIHSIENSKREIEGVRANGPENITLLTDYGIGIVQFRGDTCHPENFQNECWAVVDIRSTSQCKRDEGETMSVPPFLHVPLPSSKEKCRQRGPWQEALKSVHQFFLSNGLRAVIWCDQETVDDALAMGTAMLLMHQIEKSEFPVADFDKPRVNSAMFLLRNRAEWLETVSLPRRLLKEIIVYFFEIRKRALRSKTG